MQTTTDAGVLSMFELCKARAKSLKITLKVCGHQVIEVYFKGNCIYNADTADALNAFLLGFLLGKDNEKI